MFSCKDMSEENSNIIKGYNHRNGLVLLQNNIKNNRVGVLSKSEYRFLLGEKLISRELSGIRQGRVYVVTALAVKELGEMGFMVKPEAFAKCEKCGLEAHTKEDLEQFLRWNQSKYRVRKICLKCWAKEKRKYDK